MVKVVCLTALKTGSSSRMTSIRRPRSSACTVSTFRTTPSITETLPPLSLAPRAVPEMPGPVAQGAARINPPAECFPMPRGASGSVCPHRRLLLPGGDARIAARGRPLPEPPAEPRRARPQGPLQALGAGHSVDDAEPAALDDHLHHRLRAHPPGDGRTLHGLLPVGVRAVELLRAGHFVVDRLPPQLWSAHQEDLRAEEHFRVGDGARRHGESAHLARAARAHHGGGGPPLQPGHGLPARADPAHHHVLARPLAGARPAESDVRRHRADLPGGAHRMDVPDADRVSTERPARPLSAAHPGEPDDSPGRGVPHPHLSGRHPIVARHYLGQRRGRRHPRHRLGDLRALQRPGGVLRLTPCPTTRSSSSSATSASTTGCRGSGSPPSRSSPSSGCWAASSTTTSWRSPTWTCACELASRSGSSVATARARRRS